MDEGTNQREQQYHGYYQYPSVPGHTRQVVQQQISPVQSPESFRRSTAVQSVHRNRAQPPPPGRGGASRRRIHRSSGTAGSHQGSISSTDPLQNVALQFQQRPFSPEPLRHVQSQQIGYPTQQQQYDTAFMYGFDQSGTAQTAYGMSLPESIGGLPSGGARFHVSQQYFPSPDDAESVSQFLSTQEQLAAASYQQQQQNLLDRRLDTSTSMTSFNPTGSIGNMQQPVEQDMANLEEGYNRYRQVLITVFGYTQRGHLNEASRLLLDLSAWLIDNAQDLGLFRDDPNTLTKHRQLWNEFNICWLSLCQKQKDLTEALLMNGHHHRQPLQALPATMLNADTMERMGQELIRLCDQVEPHGLVDYQMGIWEEEILDILGQCLDLIES
ncbi:conserved hypothetical protein [Talaromyces stipitatus ATCC 10500]|uniref:Uncharacterized protein n=1 Tax=Talaromyces stipitatus (strain ATCC 10500 / CBS 375.48 / QM 6759 / NRRL 1006) TaxID=441959 RepID=B8MSN1_TALSN|nr:uncharacterized protein TSTA_005060 [Talaromyces stipitatus ATCC 10500]EED12468.1 conserved hypothetical protein [Talaromyces stipitatus ATCC 10500]